VHHTAVGKRLFGKKNADYAYKSDEKPERPYFAEFFVKKQHHYDGHEHGAQRVQPARVAGAGVQNAVALHILLHQNARERQKKKFKPVSFCESREPFKTSHNQRDDKKPQRAARKDERRQRTFGERDFGKIKSNAPKKSRYKEFYIYHFILTLYVSD